MRKFLLAGTLLLISLSSTFGQEPVVTGKVVSARDGDELPGVNIRIKNTSRGTITSIDGSYSLSIRGSSDTLVFSFIGFMQKEIVVGNQNVINVRLDPETKELDEVVVTGFQEVERKLFTGSAATVKMDELRIGGMSNATQMLEGRV